MSQGGGTRQDGSTPTRGKHGCDGSELTSLCLWSQGHHCSGISDTGCVEGTESHLDRVCLSSAELLLLPGALFYFPDLGLCCRVSANPFSGFTFYLVGLLRKTALAGIT